MLRNYIIMQRAKITRHRKNINFSFSLFKGKQLIKLYQLYPLLIM